MRLLQSFIIAFSTYSRIPMPCADWSEENRRYSMCFFPLIGVALGLVMAAWLWFCDAVGVGGVLRGSVAALLPLLITGGIHMDGFMDTLDAMASWQTRERRLEILKDSHTGAFAVIGCGAYLLLSAGLYSELRLTDALPMGCVFVLSRSLSVLALNNLPKANPGGMLASFADAARKRAVNLCCSCYAVICLALPIMLAGRGIGSAGAAGLCMLYYRRFAMKHFGGVTGDLAGWFVQISELACLAVLVLEVIL